MSVLMPSCQTLATLCASNLTTSHIAFTRTVSLLHFHCSLFFLLFLCVLWSKKEAKGCCRKVKGHMTNEMKAITEKHESSIWVEVIDDCQLWVLHTTAGLQLWWDRLLFKKKMPMRTYITVNEKLLPRYKPMKDHLILLLSANASGDKKWSH